MMVQTKTNHDTIIEEIHRTRERMAEKFGGDIDAILDDARKRQEASGRPAWHGPLSSQAKGSINRPGGLPKDNPLPDAGIEPEKAGERRRAGELGRCAAPLKMHLMTPDQQKDTERLDRYIAREGLVAVMNDTKWRESIGALQSIDGYSVRFRCKCVRDENPDLEHWDDSFPWHVPTPFKSIEWLEVNPVVTKRIGLLVPPETQDFTDAIIAALGLYSIPHEVLAGAIRITGYVRTS